MCSFFEPKAVNFLISYIKENPNCPLDEVMNDDELLESVKCNNNILFA